MVCEIGTAAQNHEIFWLPKNLRVSALATHSFQEIEIHQPTQSKNILFLDND